MEWRIDNERAIYAQLVEHIERAVVTGQFALGARLPGVRELAAQAGVNPNTMQRALTELESRGLVRAQRTSGRFVTEDAAQIARLRAEMAEALTARFIGSMRAIGCGDREIEAHFQQALISREDEG